MLPAERQLKIIDLISKNGSVQVDELAKMLDVSLMTIRRDLEKMKQEGKIDRCHGGAIVKREVPYTEKRVLETEGKNRIAEQCLKLIKKGQIIYLDAGTTTYEIAKEIKEVPNLTVITNDLEIARLFMESNANLILCGGVVQKSTGSMIGAIANMMMDNFRVDIAFMGAQSIDDQYNVLTPTMDKAVMKQTICKNAKEKYLVVDSTKFGRQALIKINHFSDYTAVITNKGFTPEEEKKLREMRATVITV
ncbi:MAG: transcriptional regulator, DeoR family [Firmicutes bacterium]|nr:transcriptional regulator, DeoR family [Bacillota bacterium]